MYKFHFFVFIIIICCVSCSDNSENLENTFVDGLEVVTGKRITEINMKGAYCKKTIKDVQNPQYVLDTTYIDNLGTLKAFYDSEGRLSKITGKFYHVTYRREQEISLTFDYDFHLIIEQYDKYGNNRKYLYVLNENGLVSKFADFEFKYNDIGYLSEINTEKKLLTLGYEKDEITKVLIDDLINKKVYIDYFTYDDDPNGGEMRIQLNREKNERIVLHKYFYAAAAYLVYKTGLFGKIPYRFNYLTSSGIGRGNEINVSTSTPYPEFILGSDGWYLITDDVYFTFKLE